MSSLLLSAGAVLYVKTTTPQGQLSFDTDSPLWGRTVNPNNRELTAGGSSGGEAALIAMRGSILGLGTDMGGSVRIPAACCGIYGVKPTSRRIPRSGTETTEVPGSIYSGIAVACGPLACTMADCRWFLEIVADLQPWRYDAQISPYSFIPSKRAGKPLNIGLFTNNGISAPLPPVAAMFDEVAGALVAAGHNVDIITLPEFAPAFYAALGFMGLNGTDRLFVIASLL